MPQEKKKQTKKKKSRQHQDPKKEEERLRRLFEVQRKRQQMIERIKEDMSGKLAERHEIKRMRREKEIKIQEKEIRDRKKTPDEKKVVKIRSQMKTILEAGVKEVNALTVVAKKVIFDGSGTMIIGGIKYKLKNNVHMVGWGKEALMLGASFEKIIGRHLKKGWLVVPQKSVSGMWNYPLCFPKLDTRITYLEAGTNKQPDDKTVEATGKVADYCRRLKKKDILVVLLSGSTEDLLCSPKGSIRLEEKLDLLSKLKAHNATSKEISTVRGILSTVRGGNLARLAYPAKVITLVMSDIPGDRMDQIAGCPTVNTADKNDAVRILGKYSLLEQLPSSIQEVLAEKPSDVPDNLVDEKKKFKFVDYHVIANIADALKGMSTAAFTLGLVPITISPSVGGTVREVSRAYAKLALLFVLAVEEKISMFEMYEAMKDSFVLPLTEEKVKEVFPSKERWGLGLAVLLGGHPKVDLQGEGRGGPNQELALYFSLDWYLKVKENPILREYVVWFLGGNTDGVDGNSETAGAYGYSSLGPGIFKRFKELVDQSEEVGLKARNLSRTNPGSEEAEEAMKRLNDLESEKTKLSLLLPDHILKNNNTNFLFENINDGDDLLDLGSTYTNVGDLHVILIKRYQCNCDGTCFGKDDILPWKKEVCNDMRCSANREERMTEPPKRQCCVKVSRPEVKLD